MTITQITTAGPALNALYEQVLAPQFPADELDSVEKIGAGLAKGTTSIWAFYDKLKPADQAETVVAGAVGTWFPDAKVMLLAWLAARSDGQGKGYGGKLLAAALQGWKESFRPLLILAEVEDPAKHVATKYGDPVARVNFYNRFEGIRLDIPYFQPRFAPDKARVKDLMLVVLHADPSVKDAGTQTVKAAPVRGYVRQNLIDSEGSVGTDAETVALLDALTPDAVPYRALVTAKL